MANFSEKSMRFGAGIRSSATITPNNSTVIDPTRAILVDVAGNVKVTYVDGDTDVVALVAGVWHPMMVTVIWSTSTTATGIHAGY